MAFKKLIDYSVLFSILLLTSCYVPETEPLKVNKVSYTIQDEQNSDKELVVNITWPFKQTSTYTGFYSYQEEAYGFHFMNIYMEDSIHVVDYQLRIMTAGKQLNYGTYTTVDNENKVDLPSKVYIEFVTGDPAALYKKIIYSMSNAADIVKFESLDANYDLLTLNYAAKDAFATFTGNIQGRFKIKR